MRKLLTTMTLAAAVALVGCNESAGPVATDGGGGGFIDLGTTAACTPGFWKNNLTMWPTEGSAPSPGDDWRGYTGETNSPPTTFSIFSGNPVPDVSFLEALEIKNKDIDGATSPSAGIVAAVTRLAAAYILSIQTLCGGDQSCPASGNGLSVGGVISVYNNCVLNDEGSLPSESCEDWKDGLDEILNGAECILDGDGNEDL